MKTNHAVEVQCGADIAFAMCVDVSSWPWIFPPCLDAQVVAESDEQQTIALTAKANDQIFSWQSVRQIDREKRRIGFAQARPSPLVKYMKGEWSVDQAGPKCIINLSHEFEVADDVANRVPNVSTQSEAMAFMVETVENNSAKELAAIKKELERSFWRHEFSEAMLIKHSPGAIFQLLRDAANWPWLLPHCEGVDMIYEDPHYQEFIMRVRVGDIEERIRSIRMLRPNLIEYFQPAPPPPLKEHQGRWTLRETEAGVEVTSWHSVVLNEAHWKNCSVDDAKQKVEMAINRNSLGTMRAIAEKLEGR
jgi:aromatase